MGLDATESSEVMPLLKTVPKHSGSVGVETAKGLRPVGRMRTSRQASREEP